MRPWGGAYPLRRLLGVGAALLVVFGGLLGYLSGLPGDLGLVIVLGPIAVGVGLRVLRAPPWRWAAPLPVLLGLTWGVFRSPFGLAPELLAGGCGLAFLAWLADDPARERGGLVRAPTLITLPAVALGITWASALLLPSGSATLGVAAGLLAFALVAVALLASRPELFDREASESA